MESKKVKPKGLSDFLTIEGNEKKKREEEKLTNEPWRKLPFSELSDEQIIILTSEKMDALDKIKDIKAKKIEEEKAELEPWRKLPFSELTQEQKGLIMKESFKKNSSEEEGVLDGGERPDLSALDLDKISGHITELEAAQIYGSDDQLDAGDLSDIHNGAEEAVMSMVKFEEECFVKPVYEKGGKLDDNLNLIEEEIVNKTDVPYPKKDSEIVNDENKDSIIDKLNRNLLPDVKNDAKKVKKVLARAKVLQSRNPLHIAKLQAKRLKAAHSATELLINSGMTVSCYTITNRMQRLGFVDVYKKNRKSIDFYAQLYKRTLVEDDTMKTSFDNFMNRLSIFDENLWVYTLLRASVTEPLTFTLTCDNPECTNISTEEELAEGAEETVGKEYTVEVDVDDLKIVEENDSFTEDELSEIVNKNIPMVAVGESVELTLNNEYIVKIRHASMKDVIEIQENMTNDFSILKDMALPIIRDRYYMAFFIEDIVEIIDEGDSEREMEIMTHESSTAIYECLYNMTDEQCDEIQAEIGKLGAPVGLTFGIDNAVCPHCGKHKEIATIDVSNSLFMSTLRKMQR